LFLHATEDASVLGGELGVGQGTRVAQVSQALELVEGVGGGGRRRLNTHWAGRRRRRASREVPRAAAEAFPRDLDLLRIARLDLDREVGPGQDELLALPALPPPHPVTRAAGPGH